MVALQLAILNAAALEGTLPLELAPRLALQHEQVVVAAQLIRCPAGLRVPLFNLLGLLSLLVEVIVAVVGDGLVAALGHIGHFYCSECAQLYLILLR